MPDPTSTTNPAARVTRATRRPGGRSARIRDAVVAAVREELVAHGFDGLSPERVAERAGVHRATVYRRWRDAGGLLAEALEASRDDDWTPPDTGTLDGDLVALNREVLAFLAPADSLARAMFLAAARSPAASVALQRFLADRYDRCAVVVERAVARGEVPPVDARPVLLAATAPVYHLLLHLGEVPDAATVTAYARTAARAFRRS